MKHKILFLCAISFILVIVLCQPGIKQKDFQRLVPGSEFIFRGTIQKTKTSTIDFENSANCAVVSVDEILDAPEELKAFLGEDITVRFADVNTAKDGMQKIFFTKRFFIGESIGVVENGSLAAAPFKDTKKLIADISQAKTVFKDTEIKQTIAAAELVLQGKVLDVRKGEKRERGSEHDPDWYEADLLITKVLKGSYAQEKITILFPNSNDVMWFRAPKFSKDTEGVWLLKKFVYQGKPLDKLTAVEKASFYPKAEEAKILRLIKQ